MECTSGMQDVPRLSKSVKDTSHKRVFFTSEFKFFCAGLSDRAGLLTNQIVCFTVVIT